MTDDYQIEEIYVAKEKIKTASNYFWNIFKTHLMKQLKQDRKHNDKNSGER